MTSKMKKYKKKKKFVPVFPGFYGTIKWIKIRKKVIVVRKTTDRPEAVDSGFAELTGISYHNILNAIKRTSLNPKVPNKKSPYGNGKAAESIIRLINKNIRNYTKYCT